MTGLSHLQIVIVEWCKEHQDKGGEHVVFCKTCDTTENVHGLEKVVAFINAHAGHKTSTRTFVNLN
jgi:hypothetical protein